ncbi:MAG: M16 family metallopeptidase [Gammaproteobacteria bacterium]
MPLPLPTLLTALLCAATLSACTSLGGGDTRSAGALPDPDIVYEKHTLDNGLTLIIHQDHKAPIAAVNVWYHVGSKDEKPGRTGFAHLFEHLMFNGSENYNDEFFRPLEPAGATDFNGTTNSDRTNYFANVPTSALDLLLWLESDRMGHLLGAIDQAKLDEQRGVVQNEKRQGENQPYGLVWETITQHAYPAGHPYSWTTIGSMEDLNAARLEDVKDWFRTYYGAANAVLVVAGDVNPAEVRQKVEHYFGDIPSGPTLRRQQQWIAEMPGEKRVALQDRVPQARLYKVWNVPGYGTRDGALLQLAAERLGGGKTSLLYDRLVYRDRIATDASAFYFERELGGQLWVIATAVPGVELAALESAIDQTVAALVQDGPGAEPLARIQTRLVGELLRGLERIGGFGGKSDLLAESQVYGGSPDAWKPYLRDLREATPAAVRATAQRWLHDRALVLSVTPTPDYAVASGGADRSRLPATGEPPALQLPALQRTTLGNGLEVVLAERDGAPLVEMSLLARGGLAADDAGQPGLARLSFAMVSEGAGGLDALALARAQESLAARISAGVSNDRFVLNLSALSTRLDASLALYADVVQRPSFPESELPRVRQSLLSGLQQQKAQPAGVVQALIPRLVYGEDHPYATAWQTPRVEQTLRSAGREAMLAYYQRWVRPDNATLLVVGDVDMATLKPLLERHFGGWQAPAGPRPAVELPPAAPATAPRVFLVNRTGAEQSYIAAVQAAPPARHAQEVPMQIVNTAFGGMFTSRLNLNLREDKHWSYGARSQLREAQGDRVLALLAPVQQDRTADAMREMQKELRELLGGRPLKADEIRAAQRALTLTLPGDNETNAGVAGSLRYILENGLPDDYYNTLVGEVLAQTPAGLRAAAQTLYRPQQLTWIVVGDLARIEGPVRKLGLGPVTVLDPDGQVLR